MTNTSIINLILFAPTSSSGPSEIENYEKEEEEVKQILPSISAKAVSSSSPSAVEVTSSPSFSISCSICTGSSVSVSSKKQSNYFFAEIQIKYLLVLLLLLQLVHEMHNPEERVLNQEYLHRIVSFHYLPKVYFHQDPSK